MTAPGIRDLAGMEDFVHAQALQHAVWGKDDLADPYDLMMVIQAEGGLAAGAFDGPELVGYVFGFPTRDPHVQHSHRLAVLPKTRGTGLGAALKWYQRDWCLSRGITHVRWTFDPLRAVNAALNIRKLGATADTYYPDYYGTMAGINAGTPSDRLLVDWHLDDRRVADRAAGTARSEPTSARFVSIPEEFETLVVADPETALAERIRVRSEIQAAIADGFSITDFDTARCRYALVHI